MNFTGLKLYPFMFQPLVLTLALLFESKHVSSLFAPAEFLCTSEGTGELESTCIADGDCLLPDILFSEIAGYTHTHITTTAYVFLFIVARLFVAL